MAVEGLCIVEVCVYARIQRVCVVMATCLYCVQHVLGLFTPLTRKSSHLVKFVISC